MKTRIYLLSYGSHSNDDLVMVAAFTTEEEAQKAEAMCAENGREQWEKDKAAWFQEHPNGPRYWEREYQSRYFVEGEGEGALDARWYLYDTADEFAADEAE